MDSDSTNINNRIIAKCLEGDIKAQFMLYKNYSAAMYNIAIRITGNKMDAEDILQESFVTVFDRLKELDNHNAFGSWLKRIVINNSISLIRKRKNVFEDIDESVTGNEELPDEVDESIDPSIVHDAIKELPDGSRAVLVLYALEGYKHREISDLLGISESTSKSQYRRALGILNKNIKSRIYND
jgi:RNA polymerase sigma factor (sigma-70 family)